MKAIKEAVQKLKTMGNLPASLQSMLEAALREDEGRNSPYSFLGCRIEPVKNDGFRLDPDMRGPIFLGAEQHLGEPVTLPEHESEDPEWMTECGLYVVHDYDYDRGHAHGWNACLDEIAELGPLYTHADPAEVESIKADRDAYAQNVNDLRESLSRARKAHGESPGLMQEQTDALRAHLAEAHAIIELDLQRRDEIQKLEEDLERVCEQRVGLHYQVERLRKDVESKTQCYQVERVKVTELSAELTNAHALLRHLYLNNELSLGDNQRILSALSASAEPSAPVTLCASMMGFHAETGDGDLNAIVNRVKTLGIKYFRSMGDRFGDCVWLFNCRNVPAVLPEWLEVRPCTAKDWVGSGGMTEEIANEIEADAANGLGAPVKCDGSTGLLQEVAAAAKARRDLSAEIRTAGRPPHTDYWHQSIDEADARIDAALAALERKQ